jgi:Suppressor of fused protein (SUFU)
VDEAPGWDAIARAVEAAHPGVTPIHFGSDATLPNQGIWGISAYPIDDHWLAVTLGLSELYEKVSDDPSTSGWGIELTIRPLRTDDQPPQWALRLLRALGGAIHSTGRPFADGHRLDPGGPITGSDDTRLRAVAFATDPELDGVETMNGRVEFLQVVGITMEELDTMKETSTAAVLDGLREHDPLLRVDPARV